MVEATKVKAVKKTAETEEIGVCAEEEIKKALEKIPSVPVRVSPIAPQFNELEVKLRVSISKIDAWLEVFDLNDDEQVALLIVKELSDCWIKIKKQMNLKEIY